MDPGKAHRDRPRCGRHAAARDRDRDVRAPRRLRGRALWEIQYHITSPLAAVSWPQIGPTRLDVEACKVDVIGIELPASRLRWWFAALVGNQS